MADTKPTLVGFTAYCRANGFTVDAIPDDDPGFQIDLDIALAWVPRQFNAVSCTVYTYTVYQWGASVMINRQPDQTDSTFFQDLRTKFLIDNFVPGVISAASDQGTAESLTVGTALSNMSMIDLQRIKDPFGREALSTMMSIGPLWGLT